MISHANGSSGWHVTAGAYGQVHLYCYSKHPCCIISILPITQYHHYTQSMACPPTPSHPTCALPD